MEALPLRWKLHEAPDYALLNMFSAGSTEPEMNEGQPVRYMLQNGNRPPVLFRDGIEVDIEHYSSNGYRFRPATVYSPEEATNGRFAVFHCSRRVRDRSGLELVVAANENTMCNANYGVFADTRRGYTSQELESIRKLQGQFKEYSHHIDAINGNARTIDAWLESGVPLNQVKKEYARAHLLLHALLDLDPSDAFRLGVYEDLADSQIKRQNFARVQLPGYLQLVRLEPSGQTCTNHL